MAKRMSTSVAAVMIVELGYGRRPSVHSKYPRFTADTQGFPEVMIDPICATVSAVPGAYGFIFDEELLWVNYDHG